ncbi:DEAD/DEAH box helicase [Rhizobium laguerreae]|uniref:DEAD/DEAH box helicase n=1 Tax=Rhizobium laguerreae TaxID=1076926 RepID=UPI001C902321|nr:DEAD/DEAH box helicase family protein [Rhizobium laguerreae]
MITLFPDQDEVRGKLRVALRSSASVLVFAPTGFGKTVLAAALIWSLFKNNKRVIFCVHRVDLITQTAKTFEKFRIPFSYIAAGYHYNPYHRVFIASISTLKNRLGKIPADYIMVDEAHLSMAAGWALVAQHYKDLGARLIGLTGSPERLDGKPLGDVWDTMVMGPSLRWLIENGRLQKYRAFSPAGLDLAGVRMRNGDFVETQLEDLISGRAVVANVVKHWKAKARGLRTIGFTPSVKSAEDYAEQFKANGIMAVALDGSTSQADRRSAFLGFADRQIEVIFNCSLFCEGFDLSAQVDRNVTVECVLDNAPTQSLAKHLQKHGRGLRADGTDQPHILLDMVGGFGRLGLPDDDREWSLEGRKKNDREVENMTCPECFATHAPALKCTSCGHAYPVKERAAVSGGRKVDEVDVELEEIDLEAARRQRRTEQAKAETLQDLIQLATSRNYQSPEKWAAKIFTHRAAKAREQRGRNDH